MSDGNLSFALPQAERIFHMPTGQTVREVQPVGSPSARPTTLRYTSPDPRGQGARVEIFPALEDMRQAPRRFAFLIDDADQGVFEFTPAEHAASTVRMTLKDLLTRLMEAAAPLPPPVQATGFDPPSVPDQDGPPPVSPFP
jgi:hypothetical protein